MSCSRCQIQCQIGGLSGISVDIQPLFLRNLLILAGLPDGSSRTLTIKLNE
jgi:hypothetical protein